MNIAEFAREEQETITAFIQWWMDNNKINPGHFPLEMEPEEWFEQYIAYFTSDYNLPVKS